MKELERTPQGLGLPSACGSTPPGTELIPNTGQLHPTGVWVWSAGTCCGERCFHSAAGLGRAHCLAVPMAPRHVCEHQPCPTRPALAGARGAAAQATAAAEAAEAAAARAALAPAPATAPAASAPGAADAAPDEVRRRAMRPLLFLCIRGPTWLLLFAFLRSGM